MLRRLNIHKDRGDVNDLIYTPPLGVDLPPSASLAEWRPPILDQEEEGSCGGHAGVYATEVIRAKLGKVYRALSRQFIYNRILYVENNGRTNHDTGCQIRSIPKAMHKWGICAENIWPYDEHPYSEEPNRDAYDGATWNRISGYQRVTDIYSLRYALAIAKLPVLIGVTCYESINSLACAKTGFIPLPKRGEKVTGGHALLCDGYTLMPGTNEYSYFGPNSWGPKWGDQGGYIMPQEFLESPDCLNDMWVITK